MFFVINGSVCHKDAVGFMNGTRQIIHVDMDAFYASVEQLDRPELVGKPVMVGGAADRRGVVSAASYEARKFGVHSAMPMSRAVKLCPQAVVLPVRMQRYVELSRAIRSIFQNYTPLIEPLSLDEAFMDVTGSLGLFGSAETIGRDIKGRIKNKLGLVASVGIAPNKFLAKLASDLDKPDGFLIIDDVNKQSILDSLPVHRLWGVGKMTEKRLLSQGIQTIQQLRQRPVSFLNRIFGNQTEPILRLAQGLDDRAVEPDREAKSISAEQTFAVDVKDKTLLLSILLTQVEEVSQRLRAGDLCAGTLTLKLRDGEFHTVTRSMTLRQPTNITQYLWQNAEALFLKWYSTSRCPLRLLGFGVSGLSGETMGQPSLFPDPEADKQKRVDKAFDAIRRRYGSQAVQRGK